MNQSERDYELAGRWLDGEDVELSGAQRALAEEIAAGVERVGEALDAEVPSGALHRVHVRFVRTRRGRARSSWARWAAAAAAAVLIGAGVVILTLPGRPVGEGTSPSAFVESFLQEPLEDVDVRADLLSEELADYQVELSLYQAWPLEMSFQELEEEVGQFDLDGSGPERDRAEEGREELPW